jgi:hypothetical protein
MGRYLCSAVTPVTCSFEPCNSHHNERHYADAKLEKSYGLHDQLNRDDDACEHYHHEPQEVALTLQGRHQFFTFSRGSLPQADVLVRVTLGTLPRAHLERLNNAQEHGLCQHPSLAPMVRVGWQDDGHRGGSLERSRGMACASQIY